jgi:hypothetical protein
MLRASFIFLFLLSSCALVLPPKVSKLSESQFKITHPLESRIHFKAKSLCKPYSFVVLEKSKKEEKRRVRSSNGFVHWEKDIYRVYTVECEQ